MATQKETPDAGTPGEHVEKARETAAKVHSCLEDAKSALKDLDSATRAATDALQKINAEAENSRALHERPQ